jgi:hypothetical protein
MRMAKSQASTRVGDCRVATTAAVLAGLWAHLVFAIPILAADAELPNARPVPAMQVLPLPYDQASFQYQGSELTRFHFGPTLERPFLYPLIGPEGRSLTRMGHPHDPVTHSHHNSVWISHQNVGGVSFWEDRTAPQIVCQRVEQYEDGDDSAWLLAVNAWQDAEKKTVMLERRRIEVRPLAADQWLMLIDMQLEAPDTTPLVLGQSPFGMIGVRMAKTICVHDGGGRLLNSEGQRGEEAVFRKPARWVDYSGPVTNRSTGGIALMDHPTNISYPTPFHVRGDGWMGASLTFQKPITLEPGHPLHLRYGLWVHAGASSPQAIDAQWQAFSKSTLPGMQKK